MNKKIFVVYVLLGICYSCNPKVINGSLNLNIINNTEKKIFVDILVFSNFKKNDTFLLVPKDNKTLSYTYTGTYRTIAVEYKIIFYNLIDTTILELKLSTYYNDKTKDSILQNFWNKDFGDSQYNYFDTLNIKDNVLTLFQKDTSMLTKFKDYYNP